MFAGKLQFYSDEAALIYIDKTQERCNKEYNQICNLYLGEITNSNDMESFRGLSIVCLLKTCKIVRDHIYRATT